MTAAMLQGILTRLVTMLSFILAWFPGNHDWTEYLIDWLKGASQDQNLLEGLASLIQSGTLSRVLGLLALAVRSGKDVEALLTTDEHLDPSVPSVDSGTA
jgi:hypothetical protein